MCMTIKRNIRTGLLCSQPQPCQTALDTVSVSVGQEKPKPAKCQQPCIRIGAAVIAVARNRIERDGFKRAGKILCVALMISQVNDRIRHFQFNGII